jgi:glucose-6-phosphate dehydrogenase assembly protein OpcA
VASGIEGTVAPPSEDRVRVRRWSAAGTTLEEVIGHLHSLHRELTHHDVDGEEHPHPRNCVLNLVVVADDRLQVTACDRTVANLAASHPLRAIIIHLRGGAEPGALDAEVTSEAHQLVSGYPVQREQVLLGVHGGAADHLSSLVEPLLVADIPTYLWWSGRTHLEESVAQDAMTFSDVLIVDSAGFQQPVQALLELAELVRDPEATIGVADLRWVRARPWRDAIAQFFAPRDRRSLLGAIEEVSATTAGDGREARVGAALLTGWMASALGWRLHGVASSHDATTAIADTGNRHHVRIDLRTGTHERLHQGDLLDLRLAGRRGSHHFALTIGRLPDDDGHADVAIELDGREPLHQQLTLPRRGDPDLLIHVLWGHRHDPVFNGALGSAVTLLETMR